MACARSCTGEAARRRDGGSAVVPAVTSRSALPQRQERLRLRLVLTSSPALAGGTSCQPRGRLARGRWRSGGAVLPRGTFLFAARRPGTVAAVADGAGAMVQRVTFRRRCGTLALGFPASALRRGALRVRCAASASAPRRLNGAARRRAGTRTATAPT